MVVGGLDVRDPRVGLVQGLGPLGGEVAVRRALQGGDLRARGPCGHQAIRRGEEVDVASVERLGELGVDPPARDLGRVDDVLGRGVVGGVGGDEVNPIAPVDGDRGRQHRGGVADGGLDGP